MSRSRVTFFYLPLLCEITAIYNLVLTRYGISHLYLIVYAISLSALLFDNSKKRNVNNAVLPYVYIVVVLTLFHLILSAKPFVTLMGAGTYLMCILYWFTYFKHSDGTYFEDIIKALRIHVIVVGLLGIVQYFLSPTLWGVIIPSDEGMMEWAANGDYSEYSLYFRSSSILTSPQNFGLFMALMFALIFDRSNKDWIDYSTIIISVTSGAFSGGKSFYLIVFLFLLFYFLKSKNPRVKIGTIIFAISLVFVIVKWGEDFHFISRILDFDKMVGDEKDGRLSVYSYFLRDLQLFGAGPGVIQNLAGNNLTGRVAESYLVQMIYELGPLAIICFISFYVLSFFRYKQNRKILFFMLLSMGYVHCFNGFIFFFFWAFLFGKQCNNTIKNDYSLSSGGNNGRRNGNKIRPSY